MQVSEFISNRPHQIASLLAKRDRVLGVDLGTKTIGLAISDPALQIASPIKMINRSKLKTDVKEIKRIICEYTIGAFIIGLPINMDGTKSARSQATEDWAGALVKLVNIPVCFWDERLSTAAVEREMLKADLSRKRRAKQIDSAAAAYILQGALDFIQLQTQKQLS